jgi:hypothetical protein
VEIELNGYKTTRSTNGNEVVFLICLTLLKWWYSMVLDLKNSMPTRNNVKDTSQLYASQQGGLRPFIFSGTTSVYLLKKRRKNLFIEKKVYLCTPSPNEIDPVKNACSLTRFEI